MEDEFELQQEEQFEDISDAFSNVGQGLDAEHKTAMLEYWQRAIDEIEQISEDGHDNDVFKSTVLPLARIKKVMKTDSEVRMISAEAPILFAKGCDIFITELTMRAWIHAEENKRRTLQRSDIATALQKSDVFDFLIDIVPREEAQPRRATHNQQRQFTANPRYEMDNQMPLNGVPDAESAQYGDRRFPQNNANVAQIQQVPPVYQQQQQMPIEGLSFEQSQMLQQQAAALNTRNMGMNVPGMPMPMENMNIATPVPDMRFDPVVQSSLTYPQFQYPLQTLTVEQQQMMQQYMTQPQQTQQQSQQQTQQPQQQQQLPQHQSQQQPGSYNMSEVMQDVKSEISDPRNSMPEIQAPISKDVDRDAQNSGGAGPNGSNFTSVNDGQPGESAGSRGDNLNVYDTQINRDDPSKN